MKIFKLPKLAESAQDGSFFLGQREIATDAVYMLYARMRHGDPPRKVVPPQGAEEIILVLKGNIRARCGKMDFVVGPGEAFHPKGCESFQLENIGSDEAVFIAAGGKGVRPAAEAAKEMVVEEAPEPQEEPRDEAREEEQEFFITREDEP